MSKIDLKSPKYLKEFKCIGGECEDSCCAGWDIDIDKISFKRYFKVKNDEMKKMFQKNIHNNVYCTSDDVDYGRVKLKKGKRCAFLDDNNLCMIYSNLGEDYLSNVCTCYPRVMNIVDNNYEMSLDVACPEAARILLAKKSGINFEVSNINLGKHIVSGYIDTKSKDVKNHPLKYFNEMRKKSLEIIQNRKYTIDQRLFILGDFLEGLQEKFEYNFNEASEYINKYNMDIRSKDYNKNEMNYMLQIAFFNDMLEKLDVFNEVESPFFVEDTKKVIEGLKLESKMPIMENKDFYIYAFKNYEENNIKENSYIFENYLANFMYGNLFPFTESEYIFDGFMMLLFRYSFIRFYLVGKYLNNKKETEEEIISSIQVFAKTIEHHKNFLEDVLSYLKENEFDNMEFAKTLL